MITNLGQFLNVLRKEGEIVEIDVPVNPHLEAAEIHRRVIDQGGPALLFNRIEKSNIPLVTNLFGTQRRMELAFGPRPEELIKELVKLPEMATSLSLKSIYEKKGLFLDLALKTGLKRKKSGPVLSQTVYPPRLTELPLLTTWEEDGGPFVTLPLVYTEHPETGIPNLGMYRLQRYDDTSTGLHCQIGKGGGFHLAEAKRLNQNLPVNVFIGGPPALILSAIAPLPENVPEMLLASLVMGGKLNLCKNPYGPLPLVAEAEFSLIGESDPNELKPEGPFGDHYGYYSLTHDYPVFRCKAVAHRKNPVCAATVVGKPKQEDFFIGDYLQDLLSPIMPIVMPAVEDLWAYGETGYHSLAAAVVKQRYRREAMVSAFRILGEGQLSLTKFLLVVDRKVDLRDFPAVLQHTLERADMETDLYVFSNLSMDSLDYTGPVINEGSKGVLLGLGDKKRDLPHELNSDLPNVVTSAAPFCPGCLVIESKAPTEELEGLLTTSGLNDWPLIVLVDDVKSTVKSSSSFLWTTFTRFEPGADIYACHKTIERNHIIYRAPILIDARMKPDYPDELFCDEKTSALVDRRWKEYFPDGTD